MILAWNAVALEANRVSHTNGLGEQTGPTLSSRALAIVHLAMYDAYVGASGSGLHPYLNTTIKTAGLNKDEAVGSAAHKVLSVLFPAQVTYFDAQLAAFGVDVGSVSSLYGIAIADKMIANRIADPKADDIGYMAPEGRGSHRHAPDAQPIDNLHYHGPFYGDKSKPFAVNKNFRINAFPALNSVEYQKSLAQVRAKGIKPELSATVPEAERRTDDETLMGIFWGYDGANKLGTPPRLYNQIIRQIATKTIISEEQQAVLFTLVNVAMADAGIFAWREKYRHNIWRPVLGIRENDTSMGPSANVGSNPISNSDCLWLPLGAPNTNKSEKNFTPNFPAYPSGHATFGAAAFNVADLYFKYLGINPFEEYLDVMSDEFNGENRDNTGTIRSKHLRRFSSFKQMISENGFSRVYLGVHWSLDAFALDSNGNPDYTQNVGGAMLGIDIAENIFNSFKSGKDGIDQSTLSPLVP